MPRIQEGTDNSAACITRLGDLMLPAAVCDVGCGTGHLLGVLAGRAGDGTHQFTGVDFQLEPGIAERLPQVRWREAAVEALPFADKEFSRSSARMCSSTYSTSAHDRRAAARDRAAPALVVPLEREYRFTFNPHVHFFPYPHSFLRHIAPVPANARYEIIGRDLLYIEDYGDGA